MSTLHPVQSKILTSLQTVNFSKFSRLRPTDMTSDHFNFHIKKLVDQSFIAKTETGDYFLTTRGKAYANFLDKNALGTTQKQPKISLLFIVRKKFGGEIKYVVQRRAKQPFIGHLVFPTWRVEWGKKISETK